MWAAGRLRWVLGALGVSLAGLDLARPYLGDQLRPSQWLVGAATLLSLGFWLRSRGRRLRDAWPVLALAALVLPAYLDHSREIQSDGFHYYSYLHSALFDRDLELANDYRALGQEPKALGVLPVGAPILWSPLLLAVHVGRAAFQLLGWEAPTGAEPIYQAAVCLASMFYGALGLFLLLDVLRKATVAAVAFWTTVTAWVGSPLRFYLTVLPSLAHGAEFFAAVLALRAWLSLRERASPGLAFRAGLACALLFLVRSQDGLMLALPGLGLALGSVRRATRAASARALSALAAGFALGALPQLLVWQRMFGTPFLIPHKTLHGAAFLHLDQPALFAALFSPRGGLFVTHPVLLAALLGIGLLACCPMPRPPSGRPPAFDAGYACALAPVLAAAWWLNASVFDWYQVRRYTALVPFLAPGLARLLAPLARAGALPLALVTFLAFRYDDAVDARRNAPGDPVPVRAALATLSDRLVNDAYRMLEPRAPRAAVALLGCYTGEPLLDEQPVSYVDLGAEPSVLRVPHPAVYLSEATVEDGRRCRWVSGRYARLFLPLSRHGALRLSVEARALETREPQRIEALWNGGSLGRLEMTPAWRSYAFEVPGNSVHAGTNELVLRFDRAPIYFRMRGEGPHEVRPAAVARLTLQRLGP